VYTYEVGGLDETEEESNNHEASVVLSSRSEGRDDTPRHHGQRQVESRLSEFVEHQVRRNLHQQVTDEQDANAGLLSVNTLHEGHMLRLSLPDTGYRRGRDHLLDLPTGPRPKNKSVSIGEEDRCRETHNIVAVQIVKDVHDNDHGQQTDIDLADKRLLGLLTLLRSQASDVGRSFLSRVGLVGIGNDFDIGHIGLVRVGRLNVTRGSERHLVMLCMK